MKSFKLFGVIVGDKGERWSEDDVAPSQFKNFLATLAPDEEVELSINSPGGSVVAGLAIANMIMSATQTFHAKVYGIAASMATAVAAACDTLTMYKASYFMIHNPWSCACGDSEDLRKSADLLDSMKNALLGFYGSVFPGVERAEIARMMDEETWMLGSDASAYGLACTLEDADMQIAACVHGPLSFARIPDPAKKFYDFDHTLKPIASAAPAPQTTPPATDVAADGELILATGQAAPAAPVADGTGTPIGDGAAPSAPAPEDVTRSAPYLALVDRINAIEQQRRDHQSRADRLAADLDQARATHAAALAERDTRLATLSKSVADYESRISAMTLNALGTSGQACAQTWPEAVEECGSYEAAKRTYPHLAEAYRAQAGKQQR